jgi:hypothetical protein
LLVKYLTDLCFLQNSLVSETVSATRDRRSDHCRVVFPGIPVLLHLPAPGARSNPEIVPNFDIDFAPRPTPLQTFNKRAIGVTPRGSQVAELVPGFALQLEGKDALFSLVDRSKENQLTPPFICVD